MAITAWSAKVWSSAICCLGEGPRLAATMHDRPDRPPSRSSGTASTVRRPSRRLARGSRPRGSAARSGTCDDAPSDTRRGRPRLPARPSREDRRARRSTAAGVIPRRATSRSSSPSKRKTTPCCAPQTRAALSAIVVQHRLQVGRRARMTRRISAVAVCCSSASVSRGCAPRAPRTGGRSRWRSPPGRRRSRAARPAGAVNGRTSSRRNDDRADRRALPEQRHREHRSEAALTARRSSATTVSGDVRGRARSCDHGWPRSARAAVTRPRRRGDGRADAPRGPRRGTPYWATSCDGSPSTRKIARVGRRTAARRSRRSCRAPAGGRSASC